MLFPQFSTRKKYYLVVVFFFVLPGGDDIFYRETTPPNSKILINFWGLPLRVLCIGIILAAIQICLVWAGNSHSAAGSGADANRPWIMVSLARDVWSKGGKHAFSVIKEMSGNPNGINVHFSRITPEFIADTQPAFIILSPQGTPWCRYSVSGFPPLCNCRTPPLCMERRPQTPSSAQVPSRRTIQIRFADARANTEGAFGFAPDDG